MTKVNDMVKKFDKQKDTLAVYFGEDSTAVAGHITKEQHVLGILALISSLVERCGGDANCVNKIIHSAYKEEEEEEEIKIGKLDLNDKEGIEKFIELLKKASEK